MVTYKTVVGDLESLVCRCGEPKHSGYFVCGDCYRKLPEACRVRMVRHIWVKPFGRNSLCLIYSRALAKLGLLKPELRGDSHELTI